VAVPVDRMGTASVAPVMVPPVPGVQKPSHRVGKRFWDRLVVAPDEKVKKPAGLKRRPPGLRQDRPDEVADAVVAGLRRTEAYAQAVSIY
jgi:hypothetical protein